MINEQISCVTSCCGNRCKALSTQNTCLVNIILLVAEIIPDNWRCFSFWHQVFILRDFLLLLLIFQSCYQRLTPCAGAWSASPHWLRTNVIGGSLCMQSLHAQCVSGTLEIRWVHLPPTWQALRCNYCAHIHCNDDAQMRYCAALLSRFDFWWGEMEACYCKCQAFKLWRLKRIRETHKITVLSVVPLECFSKCAVWKVSVCLLAADGL